MLGADPVIHNYLNALIYRDFSAVIAACLRPWGTTV